MCSATYGPGDAWTDLVRGQQALTDGPFVPIGIKQKSSVRVSVLIASSVSQ